MQQQKGKGRISLSGKKDEDKHRLHIFLAVHQLMKRYQKGSATAKQQKAIDALDLLTKKKLWYATKEEIVTKRHLEDMHARIYGKVAQKENFDCKNWAEVKKTLTARDTLLETGIKQLPNRRKLRISKQLIIAATIVAVTVGTMFFFVAEKEQPTQTFLAQNQQLSKTLPDGTTVMLNKGSSLTLSSDFNKKQRRIQMTGEVFFNVSRNPQKPFVITHGALTTVVKGTSFTISNYTELERNTLTVHSGKVSVRHGKKELAQLLADQRLIYDKAQQTIAISSANAAQVAEWTKGKLIFVDADAKELRLRMQQHFSVNVVVKDYALGKAATMRFNAQFEKDAKAEDVMEHLKLVYGVNYKREGAIITVYKNVKK